MSKFCEDRVVIVTGAGRGIGKEYALMLASHGAKVVVNDLGGSRDGTGSDLAPADEVVQEIKGLGGEAVANGDDVSDFEGAKRTDEGAYARLFHAMLAEGVAMAPGAYEAIFVGMAHTDDVLDQIAERCHRAATVAAAG